MLEECRREPQGLPHREVLDPPQVINSKQPGSLDFSHTLPLRNHHRWSHLENILQQEKPSSSCLKVFFLQRMAFPEEGVYTGSCQVSTRSYSHDSLPCCQHHTTITRVFDGTSIYLSDVTFYHSYSYTSPRTSTTIQR